MTYMLLTGKPPSGAFVSARSAAITSASSASPKARTSREGTAMATLRGKSGTSFQGFFRSRIEAL